MAIGIGLIVARITTSAAPMLIISIMFVVTVYVSIIAYSGWHYIELQKNLRSDWQPRLYRFLPIDDYKIMVVKPTSKAESIFFKSAIAAIVVTVLLLFVVIYVAVVPGGTVPKSDYEVQKEIYQGVLSSTSNLIETKEVPSALSVQDASELNTELGATQSSLSEQVAQSLAVSSDAASSHPRK